MSFARDLRTIPNIISLSRIALIFVAVGFYLALYYKTAILLGVLAGLSDYADGILARRLNQVTYLGEILDQFSDLLFEAVVILFLMLYHTGEGPSPFALVLYLAREFWVTTIRRFMSAHQLEIKSSIWGKVKTNFLGWSFLVYGVALFDVLPSLEPYSLYLARFGFYAGLGFSYLSGWLYTRQFAHAYASLKAR
ncbi:CDP-alcohol phosphatidyltransferase family protein [Myxococcota bacterium]|nr:CDP-alcohol phosphatidyltransferase family protein [Myxococcota bacterium]MBU1899815.1 CDP-alcohol phosphatidyltransferase family protein [Myxococcota bacterium]